MLNRTINPGQMSIVREILDGTTGVGETDTDTAIFQGTLAEYDIEGRGTIVGGVEQRAYDLNGDGFISVQDRDTGAIGATIIVDGVEVVLSSRGALTDDLDLLKNIERLQFADQTIAIAGNNAFPTGTVTINDPTMHDPDGPGGVPPQVTPYVGQVLTATLTGISSSEAPLGANGLPVGLTFEWQTTETGSNAGWTTITTGLTYTVRPVDPGHVLRAVAVFKDTFGVTERITSDSTDGATVPFFVLENSPMGTLVSTAIPFSVDYDPLLGASDGDIVHLDSCDGTGRRRRWTVQDRQCRRRRSAPGREWRAPRLRSGSGAGRQPVPDRHQLLHRRRFCRRRGSRGTARLAPVHGASGRRRSGGPAPDPAERHQLEWG